MKKQFIVSSFYSSSGGMSTFVRSLTEKTNAAAIETYVASNDIPKNLSESDIKSIRLTSRSNLFTCLHLLAALLKANPDHIQTHGRWHLNATVLIYKILSKLIPGQTNTSIYVIKHTDITESRKKATFFRIIDSGFDKIFFPSFFFMNKCISELGYPKERCDVAYPGVPELPIPLEQINLKEIKENKKIITYVGKFVFPRKVEGLLSLIDGFAEALKSRSDLYLLIVGDGPLQDIVEKKIAEAQIHDCNYRILGGVKNARQIYEESDLHCHISFSETFGLVVLEALSLNKNVIINAISDFYRFKEIPQLHIIEPTKQEISKKIIELIDLPPEETIIAIEGFFSWTKTAKKLGAY